jgi:hypothetical protein
MDSTDQMIVTHHSGHYNGEGIIGASQELNGGKASGLSEKMDGNQFAAQLAGTSGTSVFVGCDSYELAQTVANATRTDAAGAVYGVYTPQAAEAAAAYAQTYAATGDTDAALRAANAQLTMIACDDSGNECGVAHLNDYKPKPPE